MTADSDNNIFGRTLNPWNTRLTAGGSTGGEGALLALRGSIMGVGTDIAGSIRIPALCNAIYGFRTSVGLIPYSGVRDLTTTATDGIRCVAGPMTTSIRDCSLFVKAVMEAETWRYDSDVVSVPWRNLEVKKKLRIGVVENDGLFTPTPPVRRGLTKATDLLKGREDIEVIPLTLPDMTQIYKDIFSYATLLGPDVRQPFSSPFIHPLLTPKVLPLQIRSNRRACHPLPRKYGTPDTPRHRPQRILRPQRAPRKSRPDIPPFLPLQ